MAGTTGTTERKKERNDRRKEEDIILFLDWIYDVLWSVESCGRLTALTSIACCLIVSTPVWTWFVCIHCMQLMTYDVPPIKYRFVYIFAWIAWIAWIAHRIDRCVKTIEQNRALVCLVSYVFITTSFKGSNTSASLHNLSILSLCFSVFFSVFHCVFPLCSHCVFPL